MHLGTGESVPLRCGRNKCSYCLPLNARRRALAVAMMRPSRTITITNAAAVDDPEPWQQVRRTYNRVREYLTRESVDPGLWGTFAERGSKTGMIHVHVVQRGARPIPKALLQEASHRAGAGWTRIEAVRDSGDLTRYVGKGFGLAHYGVKGFDGQHGDPLESLALNGGRLGHFSRGFFLSAAGATIGVRDAERLACRSIRDDGEGQWVLVREASGAPGAGPA